MSTYTYELDEAVGKVRALCGDRVLDDGTAHFSDEEMQIFLDIEGGDLRLAAATALDAWGAELAPDVRSFTLGDYHESTGDAARIMSARAKDLRQAAYTTPAAAIAAVAWDGLAGFAGGVVLDNYYAERLVAGL